MSATESRKRSLFDSSDSEDDEPTSNKVLKSERDLQKTPEKEEKTKDNVKEKVALSPAQKARIEQNRQKALLIRQDKINRRTPYIKPKENNDEGKKVIRINETKLIDTGGGFFIEEEEIPDDDMIAAMKMVNEPAPLIEEDRPHCLECNQVFNNSFLFHTFDHQVCDQCRDNDDKHSLITKTDAKNEYLLKDSDLEKREPPLKFIVRKNPHNSRWGDMKLFLKLQVEKRSLEIWGTEEALEEAIEKKEDQREINKQKRFNKKMKEQGVDGLSQLWKV
ncbi:DNA repair protein complementing XP-A cells homolog isoform X2 [Macrobrachium rosenbergii]|uniref:DNA repair protein complementing XP-A cells homolog isoform X2 n=1 Tax=Macrobrachium rosenbergii TaxID=79674 RepID=UPI0034D3EE13